MMQVELIAVSEDTGSAAKKPAISRLTNENIVGFWTDRIKQQNHPTEHLSSYLDQSLHDVVYISSR